MLEQWTFGGLLAHPGHRLVAARPACPSWLRGVRLVGGLGLGGRLLDLGFVLLQAEANRLPAAIAIRAPCFSFRFMTRILLTIDDAGGGDAEGQRFQARTTVPRLPTCTFGRPALHTWASSGRSIVEGARPVVVGASAQVPRTTGLTAARLAAPGSCSWVRRCRSRWQARRRRADLTWRWSRPARRRRARVPRRGPTPST